MRRVVRFLGSAPWGVADAAAALTALGLVAWLAFPSSVFLTPVATSVDGSRITFARDIWLSPLPGQWYSEITTTGGHECASGGWRIARYQEPPRVVSYDLGAWAAPCLARGEPYTMIDKRRVIAFNLVPLRPVTVATFVGGSDDLITPGAD